MQVFMVCWSSAASSLGPQRRSIDWKRASFCSHNSLSLGKTYLCNAFRSALKSLNVELTKILCV